MSDGAPFALPPEEPVPREAVIRAGLLVALAVLACAAPGPTTALIFLGAVAVVALTQRDPSGRVAGDRGLRAAGLLAALLLLALLAALPRLRALTEQADRERCRGHLAQLGAALRIYRDNQGYHVAYPPHDGGAFLVALHTAGVLGPDEVDLLRCPSVAHAAPTTTPPAGALGPDDCSYAGRRNARSRSYPGLAQVPRGAETVVASDDDEGAGPRFNHGDVVHLLLLDGRVQTVEATDPRVAGGVGEGLLDPLAN